MGWMMSLRPSSTARFGATQAARATILERLNNHRLPGAILLHGPQGIGKATLAFNLTRAIFTATGDEDATPRRSAGRRGCRIRTWLLLRRRPKDAKGYYTVIRVEDVRKLREDLHQTRGRAGHRIAIIDSIDDCNPSAANALLKTLEEPPADTTFFLVSHRPGQLLPTIKSRCHSLALRPLADADVRAVLADQRAELTTDELDRAVSLAGGRPRRAFETLTLGDGSRPQRAPGLVHRIRPATPPPSTSSLPKPWAPIPRAPNSPSPAKC